MNTYDIIKQPLLTEKTSIQYDEANQVSFAVDKRANKIQIKESVEKAFDVSVVKVRIMRVTGKQKRLGRYLGKRADWKKAIVTLKEGDSIEYFEGA